GEMSTTEYSPVPPVSRVSLSARSASQRWTWVGLLYWRSCRWGSGANLAAGRVAGGMEAAGSPRSVRDDGRLGGAPGGGVSKSTGSRPALTSVMASVSRHGVDKVAQIGAK